MSRVPRAGPPSSRANNPNNLRGRGGPSSHANGGPSSRRAGHPSHPHSTASSSSSSSSSSRSPSYHDPSSPHEQLGLKVVNGSQELSLLDTKVTIGRRRECDISLQDPLVSGNHAEIVNGFVADVGSTNGTTLNGVQLKPNQKRMLRAGDKLQVGDRTLRIEAGKAKQDEDAQDLARSKKFVGGISADEDKNKKKDGENSDDSSESKENDEDAKLSVEELMDKEFAKIIGHDSLKKQLRQFYKKVQLDQIRINAGKEKDKKRLYHMIFSGPPGTGKTTMANLVSKIMLKMKLVSSDKVVFVNNSLELIGSYVGQTPAKVDAKVNEAKGGIVFIDEAYSIVKGGGERDSNGGQFGREAIDTLMKHMDPPTAVFIFAGYEKPMEDFLRVNEGLARRIPYRYTFDAYTIEQLCQIFRVMCDSKGEMISLEEAAAPSPSSPADVDRQVASLLGSIDPYMLSTQNAGLIANWLAFAQGERDDRVDIEEAMANPDLASTLTLADLESALVRVKEMKGAEPRDPSGHGPSPPGRSPEPELLYAEQ